jgi:hypothetical protein
MTFPEMIDALHQGEFSAVAEAFRSDGDGRSPILAWAHDGLFDTEPEALAEAFTCACFLGHTVVVRQLLGFPNPFASGRTPTMTKPTFR